MLIQLPFRLQDDAAPLQVGDAIAAPQRHSSIHSPGMRRDVATLHIHSKHFQTI